MAPTETRTLTALVTGASAGIGRELARQLATRGYDLILVSRSVDKLEALAATLRQDYGAQVRVLARDLSSGAAATELADTLDEYGIELDLLVNNAGVALPGFFCMQDADQLAGMLELNVVAPTVLARRVLDGMLARRRGRILNVASLAGFQAIPGLAAYAATKAFVLSLTEALSEELQGTGVTITALCPGLTDTDMGAQVTELSDRFDMSQLFMADVESVAREGIDAALRGETIRVPGMLNRMFSLWSQVQPRRFVRQAGGFFARNFMPD